MANRIYNALFICTANSARSIMAEALMNHLGAGRVRAYSAGSHPRGTVNPFALRTLAAMGLPTDGYRSKSWDEFGDEVGDELGKPGAPSLDFVFTVCDQAAGESCPFWPGQPTTAHWGVPDPAAVTGSDEVKAKAFYDTAVLLKRRIELMLALPLRTLDAVSLKREVEAIGKR